MQVDLARESDFGLGGLKVRPSVRQVESGKGAETLEPRIMQVLVALARRRGEVVSRDELLETCWGGVAVGEDSINRCIYRLRKLGETTGAFSLETIPRVGYRLAAAGPVAAEGAADVAAPGGKPAGVWPKRILVIGVAAAVVAAIAIVAMLLPRDTRTVEVRAPRVAVLPFDVVDQGEVTIATARRAPGVIAETLQKSGEDVLSPTVSAGYTGERKATAAENLGVRYVIDGEVSGASALKLLVRLTDVSGVLIWSREFSVLEDEADSLLLQASVRSANAMSRLRLLQKQLQRDGAREAAFLRGLDLLDVGDASTGWREARALAASEPDNAAVLASAAIIGKDALYSSMSRPERAEHLAEIRGYVERARALDPHAPGLALATVEVTVPDFATRIETLRDAIKLDEFDAELHTTLARELLWVGHIGEAGIVAGRGFTLDPLSPNKSWQRPKALVIAGRHAEVLDAVVRPLQLWPNLQSLVQIRFEALLWSGDYASARRQFNDPVLSPLIHPMNQPVRPLSAILDALQSGRPADLDKVEAMCAERSKLQYSSVRYCMGTLSRMGRHDAIFRLMDQLYFDLHADTAAERDQKFLDNIFSLVVAEELYSAQQAPVREDPRIIPVFERLGLVNYWRSTGHWPDFCQTEPRSVCARLKGE